MYNLKVREQLGAEQQRHILKVRGQSAGGQSHCLGDKGPDRGRTAGVQPEGQGSVRSRTTIALPWDVWLIRSRTPNVQPEGQ
eukprot:scaffold314436_cov22-Tisochrysis_lutea.AAC.2